MFNSKKFYLIALFLITLSGTSYTQSKKTANELSAQNISVSFNGKFIFHTPDKISKEHSQNGIYRCQYEIGNVGDEVRQLVDFKFYEKDQLLFILNKAPASDLYVSNAGFIAFLDQRFHFKQKLIVHFYAKNGSHLFSRTFKGASLFSFSENGKLFGIGTAKGLTIISIPDQKTKIFDTCDQFGISENNQYIAIARENKIKIFSNGELLNKFDTQFMYPRKIRVSEKYDLVAVIDKKNLQLYSISAAKLIFRITLKGKNSFRDLALENGKILAGVHYRHDGISKGFLQVYNLNGSLLQNKETEKKKFKKFDRQLNLQKPLLEKKIPWPFFPFDSMRTVWNYYEQHMSYGDPDWSYLHQGLDLITPIGEPVYSVSDGVVKCVLTLGGASYWRIAISKEQAADFSNGWLYAHLVENSIQFDVGDSVKVHDYLGNIIQWSSNWGHIHFVEISDSGLVWRYNDNEWGINYNPLLSLTPDKDLIPPVIENVFPNSKFAFCTNETSNYLDSDSLYGEIDIIAKIYDYIGNSPWQQPAFETFYWVTKLPEGQIVFPKTLGQRLNHSFDFYASDDYEPYATTLYKRDKFLLPSRWMETKRNYYHILTNNNGDSLLYLTEKNLAFSTTDYYDGDYRIFVEARDEYGNSTIDSADVNFRNGNITDVETKNNLPLKFELRQNYPNPFNPSTKITIFLSEPGLVKLSIFNILGKNVYNLANEFKTAGTHFVLFDATNLSAGIYFYRIEFGNFTKIRKMLLLP